MVTPKAETGSVIHPGDVRRWTSEAAPALVGGRVHRVWREGPGVWVVLVRHHEGGDPQAPVERRVALDVCLEPVGARCVAVPPEEVQADDKQGKKAQARDGHPFLALLRRRLVGGVVEGLTAVEGDRIVWLDVRVEAPVEGAPALRLAIELLGRGGNLILCERLEGEERCVRALEAGRASRPFEPGTPYRVPPPRAGGREESTLAAEVEPDPKQLALGVAVARLQRAAALAAAEASRKHQLGKALRRAVERQRGIQAKLEAQLRDVELAPGLERQGDLLKANLKSVKRGQSEVEVEDYDAEGRPVPVTIALDPKKSAQDNMAAYYKRAKKLRRGETAVQMRLGETDGQLAELEGLEAQWEAAGEDDAEALDALEAALEKRGDLPKRKAPKAKVQVNQGPRSYRTSEGHEVLVGRSDEENDRLTMRIARGNDLFFHVRGCPGSHVILRVDPKRPPNHESLLDAATLAVHYSKARQRGRVAVNYTPQKWVSKPKGAKPGLVQIVNAKTVTAGGDPARLERVLSSLQREDS